MLVITLGDPWSVNIEIISQCLSGSFLENCHRRNIPVTLIGSFYHWEQQSGKNLDVEFTPVDLTKEMMVPADKLSVESRGNIALQSLQKVVQINANRLAVLTMPIDKHACWKAGFDFPGQTEFFEKIWQTAGLMLLAGPKLRVGLVTTHIPLSRVAQTISAELIESKIHLMFTSLKNNFQINKPRLAVTGLNPHCGDQGMFGSEDQTIITKVIKNLKKRYGDNLTGPLPADTVFYHAYQGMYDGVLAMYHDQGLGPLKTVHFDSAINISAGLPHLRVSPDHGPAKDLFMQNKASLISTQEALNVCLNYLMMTGQ